MAQGWIRGRHLSAAAWSTMALFTIDMVTNLTDYLFHIYLGWSLAPGDFAIVQTINALLLILVTAFAVLQPVVARYVATFNAQALGTTKERIVIGWRHLFDDQIKQQPVAGKSRTLFQRSMWQGLLLGLALFGMTWLIRAAIAGWLNVPTTAVSAAALIFMVVLLRPVTLGMLQGQQQFLAFGLSRTSYAISRLALAVLLVTVLGGGATAAVLTLPLGGLFSLVVALFFLGREVWQPGEPLTAGQTAEGWRLAGAALLAYTAFMVLQNLDLIWANRLFTAEEAGVYAAAVVLRRALIVLPGAISVILYPRMVAQVTRHRLPDRLLAKALAAVSGVTTFFTAVYFLFAPWIVRVMFGEPYEAAAPLLGWMGVAMIAMSIAAIWLNLFLATRPWPFVFVLVLAALLQAAWYATTDPDVRELTTAFILMGWLVAAAGLGLYLAWLRPRLQAENVAMWRDRARGQESAKEGG